MEEKTHVSEDGKGPQSGRVAVIEDFERRHAAEQLLLGDTPRGVAFDEDDGAHLIDLLVLGFGDLNVDFEYSILRALALQALSIKQYAAEHLTGEDHEFIFSMAMDVAARARAAAELHRRIIEARRERAVAS